MSMHDARSAFEMVKLSSGKVLAVGGRGRGSGGVLSSAELFDPATKTWQTQGSMADGRASFAAVAMPDGRVLAAGGMSGTGMMLNTSEVGAFPSLCHYTTRGFQIDSLLALINIPESSAFPRRYFESYMRLSKMYWLQA